MGDSVTGGVPEDSPGAAAGRRPPGTPARGATRPRGGGRSAAAPDPARPAAGPATLQRAPGRRRETATRLLVAAAAGLVLHLAYPRPGWDLLGWVALAPVFALAATARSPGQAMLEGWLAGLAFFLPLLRWITHSMTHYSALTPPLAGLVLLALAAYCALYVGAVTAAVAWLERRLGPGAVWLAPVFWVTGELARTHVFSGFPWGLLGYVPYRWPDLIGIAAWTGVYGVSFLLALCNTALAWVLVRRSRPAAVTSAAVVGVAVGAMLGVSALRPAPGPGTVPVGIVQGNIDQAIKWDKAARSATLEIYAGLTRQIAPGSRLVVWPEAAVPAYLSYEPGVIEWLTALAGEVGTPLLVGAPDARQEGATTHFLNSAFLVRAKGLEGRYDKIHLVPFGEYVPLRGLLFFVEAIAAEIGDFTPGRDRVVFPLEGAPFGTVICYEVIFPDLVRGFVREGARLMVNITNDAWFGESSGPVQHLAMVPLRAVENGVAVVRAANTGISALVLPDGRIGPELSLSRRGALRVEAPLAGRPTFYTRFGDLFAYGCAAATLAALAARTVARRRD
jgi:apolipoprotein N-acyltransferase